MKMKHTLLFIISFFVCASLFAQNNPTINDTVPTTDVYGLRVGTDLVKIGRSLFEENYTGFEIQGDLRISKKFYLAAELGNESNVWEEAYVSSKASGNYVKLGFDFNAYENWKGMDNAINVGLRYGFSTFKQEMLHYRVYTTNPIFPSEPVYNSAEFTGLNAHWTELIVSVKAEVLKNIYLSLNVQLKLSISEKAPDNFANLYVPGFNRTYDFSNFGVGYGYSISYRIPLLKKKRTTAISGEED